MFLDLITEIRKFNSDRDWGGDHTPKNLAMSVMIEAAELGEKFQWMTDEESWGLRDFNGDVESVADEIADVLIYLLNLCDKLKIHPDDAVRKKIKKNAVKYPKPKEAI